MVNDLCFPYFPVQYIGQPTDKFMVYYLSFPYFEFTSAISCSSVNIQYVGQPTDKFMVNDLCFPYFPGQYVGQPTDKFMVYYLSFPYFEFVSNFMFSYPV